MRTGLSIILSLIAVTFAPEFQQVVFHRITILRDGASLNRLDGSRIKVIEDSSRFNVTSLYSGGAADDIRSSFEETSLKDIEERYRKYYAAVFDGIRLTGPVTYNDDSLKNEFTVHEHYTIPQLWSTDKKGKKYFEFSIGLLDKTFPDPKDATGNEPLALNYPYNIHYTLNLALPEDWEFGGGELHVKNADYQFDTYILRSGQVRSTFLEPYRRRI